MITIRLESPVSISDQIRTEIRHAIASAELIPGDPLPTVRQIASDLGVNFNTVARAYRQLEAEGLVTTVRGRGTIVKSSHESPQVAEQSLRERLQNSIRNLLCDARLANMTREQLESLFYKEALAVWPKE